jgi:hypothetical protein
VLFDAWAAKRDGKAAFCRDAYYPECHRLAERGWLERRWNDANGDLVYR